MRVYLRSDILPRIAADLRFGSNPFEQEEGGYLIGRFNGTAVEVVTYTLDRAADRTPATIRFREAHMDHVADLIRDLRDPTLYRVGTWHTHPPGFGTRYSSVDAEYLFVEHAVLRADGIDAAMLPQVHMIVGWGEVGNYQVYGMRVESPGFELRPGGAPVERHLSAIEAALRQGQPAGLLLKGETVSYSGGAVVAALTAGTLEGVFRCFPHGAIAEEVEAIYLANLVHHVRRRSGDLPRQLRRRQIELDYYRITAPDGRPQLASAALAVGLNGSDPRPRFVPCEIEPAIPVLLSNPDTPADPPLDLGVPGGAVVADVGRTLQAIRRLTAPPILSAVRPLAERERWLRTTMVDEAGEVTLPDDAAIADLADPDPVVPLALFWRSPDLRPETVFGLRTKRLRDLGYDLDRLRGSRVVVAGVGLLGSEVASLLAACGVGHLVLLDSGVVDFANVFRQRLYTRRDVYRPKAEVAAARLSEGGGTVDGHRLSIPNVGGDAATGLTGLDGLVAEADLVVGAVDSFSGRAVLQALCLRRRVPFLSTSVGLVAPGGQADIFLALPNRPGCYACSRRLMPTLDTAACTLAPPELAPIAGGIVLRLAIELLHGQVHTAREVTVSETAEVLFRVDVKQIGSADPACEVCGPEGLRPSDGTDDEFFARVHTWLTGCR